MREIRLIVHAAGQSNRSQSLARRQHEALGHFDSPPQQIGARRHPERALEDASKMALAQGKQRGELADTNPLGKVGVDMCDQQSRLPDQQPSSRDAPSFGGRQSGVVHAVFPSSRGMVPRRRNESR